MVQRRYNFYQTRIPGPACGGSLLLRGLRRMAILALLGLGFMFSVVLFAVLAVGGLLLWGWFWWKTRKGGKPAKVENPQRWKTRKGGKPAN